MRMRLRDIIKRAGELKYRVQWKGPNRARRREIEGKAKREERQEQIGRVKKKRQCSRKEQKKRRKQKWRK